MTIFAVTARTRPWAGRFCLRGAQEHRPDLAGFCPNTSSKAPRKQEYQTAEKKVFRVFFRCVKLSEKKKKQQKKKNLSYFLLAIQRTSVSFEKRQSRMPVLALPKH